MSISLFLNPAEWRRVGCSDQQIKFLEELLDRSGGVTGTSGTSNASLAAQILLINGAISEINDSIADLESGSSNSVDHIINSLQSSLKKTFSKINALESTQTYNVDAEIKRLKNRITQLEDAQ